MSSPWERGAADPEQAFLELVALTQELGLYDQPTSKHDHVPGRPRGYISTKYFYRGRHRVPKNEVPT